MSAAAIHLLDHLRENGVEDDRAVKIAEAFDRRVDEVLAESKAHSDRNRAESEEKAKVQFVPAADYHARDKTLATREDVGEVRKEIAAQPRVDNLRDTLLAEIGAYRPKPGNRRSARRSARDSPPALRRVSHPCRRSRHRYRQTLFWGLMFGAGGRDRLLGG